ncbi:caspase family protein [Streptomyces sp. NPDC051079]|uniref:caspase family protein n=1 Tax=Streptomyces sp. NPDC051079 TaxID=3155043 RepID=UPI003450529F
MRYLIAAGTRHYGRHPGLAELPLAHDDVDRVVRFFTSPRMGYTRVLEEHSLDPEADAFEDALSEWCIGSDLTPDDVVVVYYAGHGDEPTPGGRYRLACADSREGHARSWLSLENLTEALAASPVRHVLFVIDACHASAGAAEITAVARGIVAARPRSDSYGSGTWVLASARHRDTAKDGAFVTRLVEACERGDGPSQRYLSPATVTGRINRAFEELGERQRTACSSSDQTEQPPFFRNPAHDPSAEVAPGGTPSDEVSDLTSHFEPRGRGVEHVHDSGSYFTGRGHALTVLRDQLNGEGSRGALAVTAAPGSGKSAVLGRLVLEEHSDVSINAHHQVLDDIVGRLAAAADLTAALPATLLKALADRKRPLRVVVDSLDEAGPADDKAEAQRIAWDLLRPLAAIPCVRLVVGTRRELLPYLGDRVRAVDLDSPQYADDTDTAEYVERILTDAGSPYEEAPDSARAIAEEVARRAGHCFLVARMVASALLRGEPVDTSIPGWALSLPSDVGGAFEEYLRRLPIERRENATSLLTALAFGEGHGLPRKIWLSAARRLSELPLREADIDALIEENGSYLSSVEVAGIKHFRLYHQELTDHLRQRMLRRRDLRDVAEHFVATLLDLTPDRDWYRAHPYVRAHLATHAAAAGTIEHFVTDPAFVLAAEPTGLLPAVRHVRDDPALALAVERYVGTLGGSALHGTDRAARLAFAAESHGAAELARRAEKLSDSVQRLRVESRPVSPHRIVGRHEDVSYSTTSFSSSWLVEDTTLPDGGRVVLAVRQDGLTHESVAGATHVHLWALDAPSTSTVLPHPAAVVGLALLPARQGPPLAVTLDAAGDLRVWDLVERTLVRHAPGTGYEAILDTGELSSGTPVVVCSGKERVVVHDLTTGPVLDVECPRSPEALGNPGATARLVPTGDVEPALIVCDGVRGTVTRWTIGHPGTYATLLEELDSPRLLDGTLRSGDTATVAIGEGTYQSGGPHRLFLLDCASGRASSTDQDKYSHWLQGGFVSLDDAKHVLVAHQRWGDVQIISTATGQVATTATPTVSAEFFVPAPRALRGRIHSVVGGHIEGVQVLDCSTGLPVSAPMYGHEGAVSAVHLLGSGTPETLDILTLGNDGTARLWQWRYDDGARHQDQTANESRDTTLFDLAHTQAVHGWSAFPDIAVASSWGSLRLVDATVLDGAETEGGELAGRTLLEIHNAMESWKEDPDGSAHLLVKSEKIVDTGTESLTQAGFSWHHITAPESVVCAEPDRLTSVPWGVECHLVPASARHASARMVGYCPVEGKLYAVASHGAGTETRQSWWKVDTSQEMVHSTAFTARSGHAVLLVGVRPAAVRGDFTISHHFVASHLPGADDVTRGFLWDATADKPLRDEPLELPARLTALVPHHAAEGTRYVALACRDGKAAVLDLETDRALPIHPAARDHGRRGLATRRELTKGSGFFLRWADMPGGAAVLLYMDATESGESVTLPVTLWNSATPEAPTRTLAVRARRLLWTGAAPSGETLLAVSDEHGVALCHLPSGERIWAAPLPALVTSGTVLPGSPTLDLAVGTQQGVVLLRPRLSAAWKRRLGVA